MQDRPSAVELLDAVRDFLEQDLLPGLEGRKRFLALVCVNALGIVGRELVLEEGSLVAEWDRLVALVGDDAAVRPSTLAGLRADVRERTQVLCERIRNGDADDAMVAEAVRAHVRTTVVEKLRVVNPRFDGGSVS